MENKKLTIGDLLSDGIRPSSIAPESENLAAALKAVAKLSVVELTYLQGRISTDLETYRARLVDDVLGHRPRKSE